MYIVKDGRVQKQQSVTKLWWTDETKWTLCSIANVEIKFLQGVRLRTIGILFYLYICFIIKPFRRENDYNVIFA